MQDQIICPFCSTQINATAYFCPNCGKKIRERPPSTDTRSQVLLYLVSLLLPPLFIGRTIRYIKSFEPKTKEIGIISLVITIVALVIISWITISFIQKLNSQVNQLLNESQFY